MKKKVLIVATALMIGVATSFAQNPKRNNDKMGRPQQIEQMIKDLGLNEEQAEDFKAAMKDMRPGKKQEGERPSKEEMQKKRKEMNDKIKSILTEEQSKKFQEMRPEKRNNKHDKRNMKHNRNAE